MIGFLVVLVGTAMLFWWVGRGPKGGKWALLVLAGFAGWVVLPSVFLQATWGYHRESGAAMGGKFRDAFSPGGSYYRRNAIFYATEICGDAAGFDVEDPSVHFVVFAEQEPRHFFYYSKYSTILHVGVGWKDRFCTARYFVSERRKGELLWIPRQLFPYPFFLWFSSAYTVEQRLLERLQPPPKAPDGLRSLAPGQCATGEVPKGEAHRFQVQVPDFVPSVQLDPDLYCAYGKDWSAIIEWTKDGRPLAWTHPPHLSEGGGLYGITVRAPANENMAYSVGLRLGLGGCIPVKEASYGCVSVRDPDRPGGYVDAIRPKNQDGND